MMKMQMGKRTEGKKASPMCQCRISIDVVLTDQREKYTLEVGDDNIIFVIKPTGYKFALDEYNFPKSYYIHKPGGSPTSFYPASPATGNLPKSVDFGMIKYEEPDSFSSFIFGDSQAYSEQEINYFTR